MIFLLVAMFSASFFSVARRQTIRADGAPMYLLLPETSYNRLEMKVLNYSNEIVRVKYYTPYGSNEYLIGESTDSTNGFADTFSFSVAGTREIFARGFDSSGELIHQSFTKSIEILEENEYSAKLLTPSNDAVTYNPVKLTAQTLGNIRKVDYYTMYNGSPLKIGVSYDVANNFETNFTFSVPGSREFFLRAYNHNFDLVVDGYSEKISSYVAQPGEVITYQGLSSEMQGWGQFTLDSRDGFPAGEFSHELFDINGTSKDGVSLNLSGADWYWLAATVDGQQAYENGVGVASVSEERIAEVRQVALDNINVTDLSTVIIPDKNINGLPEWRWSGWHVYNNHQEVTQWQNDSDWINGLNERGGGFGARSMIRLGDPIENDPNTVRDSNINQIEFAANSWWYNSEQDSGRHECTIALKITTTQPNESNLRYFRQHSDGTSGWHDIEKPSVFATDEEWLAKQRQIIDALIDGDWHLLELTCEVDSLSNTTSFKSLKFDNDVFDLTHLAEVYPQENVYGKSYSAFALQLASLKGIPPTEDVDLVDTDFFYWVD